MKNLLYSIALLTSVLTVSCKKGDEAKPQTPAVAAKSIQVLYIIQGASENMNATYSYPNADGKLVSKSEIVTSAYYTVSFTSTSGNHFDLEASNVLSERKAIHVQIYIDGNLFASGVSQSSPQSAIAEGNY